MKLGGRVSVLILLQRTLGDYLKDWHLLPNA